MIKTKGKTKVILKIKIKNKKKGFLPGKANQ